jgi:DNA invertase Pin-like site-specific DNA recombinase
MKTLDKLVTYYRVRKEKRYKSTHQTIEDAWGIKAQRIAVETLQVQRGGMVSKEYTEIETGINKRTRPELAKAISHARLQEATLVIAKLDRLARNVHVMSGLMESKIDFICCDNPGATPLTIHILAAVAQEEARAIAARTKDALAEAKRNGVKLGSAREDHWKGREHKRGWKQANKASIKVRQQQAMAAYGFLIEPIRNMQADGMSLRAIAAWLNRQGHMTTRQKPFTATAVMRILEMFERLAA